MTDAEFEKIVADLRAKGLEIDRPVKECEGWTIGERVRVLEDDENEGLYSGDEGVIIPEEVGAIEYGNLRTRLYMVIDGQDAMLAIDGFNIEAV